MQSSNKNIQIPEMTTFENSMGPYILHSHIEDSFAKKLYEEGKKIPKKNDASKFLASRIKKVRNYNIEEWLTQGLLPYINKWIDGWNKFSKSNYYPPNAVLKSIWINFQNAGETNAEHSHPNADLSFVIYLKIPETISNNYKNFLSNPSHTGAPPGSIFFKYGEYQRLAVDGRVICPTEKSILMWPGYLRHGVQPFTCEGIRISVAGNISFLD